MQIKKTNPKPTEAVLSVSVDADYLAPIKKQVLEHLSSHVTLPGFRVGKAPLDLVEKQVDQSRLQSEVLQASIEKMYAEAVEAEKLWPVSQPDISLKKFVPFTEVEIEAKFEVLGPIKLGNYKNLKIKKAVSEIKDEDINKVLDNIALRAAEKKAVKRGSQTGDEVWIDFSGQDEKGQPIQGAQGKDYPLILGSNTFIHGFEDNVLDMKPSQQKTFSVTFPKDYHLKALANKKATFDITVNKIEELIKPEINDEFAKKTGNFNTLAELKADVRKQLEAEKNYQEERNFEAQIVKQIVESSTMTAPEGLVAQQQQRLLDELKQNLVYRGQTWPEFLEAEKTTEEKYLNEVIKPESEERVKVGLVLSEIAEKEQLTVAPEEVNARIAALKTQHANDAQMLEQLDNPDNRRDIASRLLTEKTLQKLIEHNS